MGNYKRVPSNSAHIKRPRVLVLTVIEIEWDRNRDRKRATKKHSKIQSYFRTEMKTNCSNCHIAVIIFWNGSYSEDHWKIIDLATIFNYFNEYCWTQIHGITNELLIFIVTSTLPQNIYIYFWGRWVFNFVCNANSWTE